MNWEITTFIAYFVILLGVALVFYFNGTNKNSEDFLLGGRSMGPWVTALSAQASDMSAWLLMGLPGSILAFGFGQMWIGIGLAIGTAANWILCAKRLRTFSKAANDSITLPQYLTNRFAVDSRALQLVCALIFLFAYTIYVASALVAGDAATVAQAEAAAKKLDIPAEVQLTDKGVSITVTGISGHAAYPETARNANDEMLLLLRELGVQGDLCLLADKIGLDYKGEGLEISVSDGISGYLTCNLGIIRAGEGGVYATLDIRYPVMTNPDMIIKNVSASLPGMRVEAMEVKEPHHVPAGSELVQKLLDAYHEVTGYERKCLYTGGGTYARSLQEGVAFGASFPQDEDLAHQANEYADIEGLYKNIKIFALAIVKLAGKA